MDVQSQYQHLIGVTSFYGQTTNLQLLVPLKLCNSTIELIFKIIMGAQIMHIELELEIVSINRFFLFLFRKAAVADIP